MTGGGTKESFKAPRAFRWFLLTVGAIVLGDAVVVGQALFHGLIQWPGVSAVGQLGLFTCQMNFAIVLLIMADRLKKKPFSSHIEVIEVYVVGYLLSSLALVCAIAFTVLPISENSN